MKKLISAVLTAACMVSLSPMCVYADEWVQNDNGYVYQYDDGTAAPKGWLKLGDKTYYIQKDGTRKTGWLKTSSGNKYYFGKDGVMYKSKWATFKSGNKYYFDSKGVMVKDCSLKIDGVTYFFDEQGKVIKEFEIPIIGTSKEQVLKECGITNYNKVEDENQYKGTVLFFVDRECDLTLYFDSDDKLEKWTLGWSTDDKDFGACIKSCIETFGFGYVYNDALNMYIWNFGSCSISVSLYTYEKGFLKGLGYATMSCY